MAEGAKRGTAEHATLTGSLFKPCVLAYLAVLVSVRFVQRRSLRAWTSSLLEYFLRLFAASHFKVAQYRQASVTSSQWNNRPFPGRCADKHGHRSPRDGSKSCLEVPGIGQALYAQRDQQPGAQAHLFRRKSAASFDRAIA